MTGAPESAGYSIAESDLAGRDRMRPDAALRDGAARSGAGCIRRARELIAKIGGEVPPIRIARPRRQAALTLKHDRCTRGARRR